MPRAKEDDVRPFSTVEVNEPSPAPRGPSLDRESLMALPMSELREYAEARGIETRGGIFAEKQQLVDAVVGPAESASTAAEAAAAFAAAGFGARKPEPAAREEPAAPAADAPLAEKPRRPERVSEAQGFDYGYGRKPEKRAPPGLGDSVILVGLSKADLNGVEGVVCGATGGRVAVRLSTGEERSLKWINLRVLEKAKKGAPPPPPPTAVVQEKENKEKRKQTKAEKAAAKEAAAEERAAKKQRRAEPTEPNIDPQTRAELCAEYLKLAHPVAEKEEYYKLFIGPALADALVTPSGVLGTMRMMEVRGVARDLGSDEESALQVFGGDGKPGPWVDPNCPGEEKHCALCGRLRVLVGSVSFARIPEGCAMPGAKVTVHGLTGPTAAEMNGQEGSVVEYKKVPPGQGMGGRWTVDFAPEGQVTNAFYKALRPERLRRDVGNVCADCHRGCTGLRRFWPTHASAQRILLSGGSMVMADDALRNAIKQLRRGDG